MNETETHDVIHEILSSQSPQHAAALKVQSKHKRVDSEMSARFIFKPVYLQLHEGLSASKRGASRVNHRAHFSAILVDL